MEFLTILIGACLINNLVLTKFLGLCVFFGVSKKLKPSMAISVAVVFVMGSSSVLCWLVYETVLKPFHLEFLRILVFVLITSSFVQLVEIYVKKMSRELYQALGVYLVLIASNCAVLAPPIENLLKGHNLVQSLVFAIGSGLGFALAIIMMAFIRERLELAEVPEALRGMPIAFIVAGLLAIAFFGFSGMIKV
jgi:electron transport complex protein RnfA